MSDLIIQFRLNKRVFIINLPVQFENIAIELGIDKIKALFKEFGGTSVYFPTEKMIYKDARDREIVSEYNGFNHKELAAKYNMSESYIRAIINRHKKRNYTPD